MEKLIHISHPTGILEGMLKIPEESLGLIIFVHGSGSSRFSPRNNFVADVLNDAKLATLLIDLLSRHEDEVYQTRFDIDLLSKRLDVIIQWLEKDPETKGLTIGLFGSSTGAAAALEIAALRNKKIKAVVSRGGRPDLALGSLHRVLAPTLLLVGGDDLEVLKLNQIAFEKLECLKKLEVIPHATHLFEEPGCLQEVARLAKHWFKEYLEN